MPTTSPDSISYPDTSYTGGFVAAIAALATSIQMALSKRGRKSYQWADATARAAQAGMAAGDTGYQVDTAIAYRYSGSAWKAWESDWISYTATLASMAVGTGGGALNSTDYKWMAGRLCIRFRFTFGSSGTTFPSQPTVTIPAGITLRAPLVANELVSGRATLNDVSAVSTFLGHVRYNASDVDKFGILANAATAGGLATITTSVPFTWAAGDSITGELIADVA